MSDKRQSTSKRDWLIAGGIGLAVVVIWGFAWWWIDKNITSATPSAQTDEAARGTFGDKFGAVNALFSGLAFAGIIFTIYLQRRELSLQREDIEEQNETLRQQRFENSFFHLLDLHSNIVDKLELGSFKKRQSFAYFSELLKRSSDDFAAFQPLSRLSTVQIHQLRATQSLSDEMRGCLTPPEISTLEAMLEQNTGSIGQYLDPNEDFHHGLLDAAYMSAHEKSRDGLSHYFRNLYHVYRFIDESPLINDQEKKKYARIVRAQLSDDELLAILYNALARGNTGQHLEFGFPKMTVFVRKYEILQNLNSHSVIHPIHLTLIKNVNLGVA